MSVKLLKDLNFTEIINNTSAVTEAGKDMLNKYRGYVYSNPVNCTIVNNFVKEASNFGFDTGLVSILESVHKFINENNISWKLASACESIGNNNGTYNYLAKVGIEKVEKLLEMKEADVISYIKAGCLKSIQFIPEFRNICKEVYKTSIVEQHTPAYSIVNPISFVLNENNTQYISVLGKTLSITEGKVSEATCNDETFVNVNRLLESFKSENDTLVYEYETVTHETIKFVIEEGKLTMTKGSNCDEFDSISKFNEHANMVCRIMPMNEKMNFMKVVSGVSTVFENINNVVVLDCTKLISTSTGTVCAITEAENNVNLTVFRSYNAGTSSNNYEYVVEALKNVTKISGLDLRHLYEERINEDCKKEDPETAENIQKQLQESKEAKLDIRKKQIAMLAEKYKNDPAKITLLNSLARELSLLD
jgi:3,4-dihydroxy-2-butanone 4-phosphate synthase